MRNLSLCWCALAALLLAGCLTPKALNDSQKSLKLGHAYFTEGDHAAAITHYKAAVKKNKWDREAWHHLGLAYFASDIAEQAEASLLKAIDLSEGAYPQAQMNLGTLYLETERFAEAEQLLEAALANPEYRQPARARHNLGWAKFNRGDYAGARDAYRKVLREFPRFCPSLKNLAMVDEAEGRLEDALARYRQALDCSPGDLGTLHGLGSVEARLDLVGDACGHLDTVVKADPYGDFVDSANELLRMLDCEPIAGR
jgi:type IV pilus assembly protein PilF